MTFPMTTNPFTFNPLALGPSVSQLQAADSTILPISMAAKQRNAALDWLFYDVTALTPSELQFLVTETNREGSILVVGPRARGATSRATPSPRSHSRRRRGVRRAAPVGPSRGRGHGRPGPRTRSGH